MSLLPLVLMHVVSTVECAETVLLERMVGKALEKEAANVNKHLHR
jgi:hypothetical protein